MPVRLGPSDRPRQPLQVVALAVVSGPAMLWGLRLDDGKWTTPAGHLEPGEDPRAGAVRELWEEAGIRADPTDLRDLGARQSGQYLVHCFRLDLPEQVGATSDHDPDEEVGEWRWAGLEDGKLPAEIADNLHVPTERNALLQALGLAKRESFVVAPGEHQAGAASALLRPHPAGRDWQVVWSAGGIELGRTGRLSKTEAETAVGEWLEKAAGDTPPAAPVAAPSPTPKKPRAPRAPKTPKPEPEKNLVVQHNISDRGLANAHKLGGLPAPSLAVAHKDSPLTGFGEISLVAHPSMVDPKDKVPLFDSDVYSPRYPRAKRRINERAARQLEQELRPHLEETNCIGYRSLDAHDFTRDLEREQPEDLAEKRNGATAALGLAYLQKMEEAKKENEEHFGRLVSELTPHHTSFKDGKNAFGRYDNAAGVVQDFLKLKSVDRALAASGYKPGDVPEPVKAQIRQFAQELTVMPTEYFEAKPQRAVGLHEFRGAAVPHDASPETLDVLRQHGLRVEPYKRGDEEDRKRAIQKLAQEHDLMLSEGLSKAEGAEGTPRYDAISNLMRHPDPAERAIALKMAGVGRRHLAQALLSGDSALVAAALAHPSLDEETIGALAGSSGRWAEKRTLLARADLTGRHLEQMVRSAVG